MPTTSFSLSQHATEHARPAAEAHDPPQGAPTSAAVHARVLSVVAARICGAEADATSSPCIKALSDAVAQSDIAFQHALARLRTSRKLSDADVVDEVIPAVARQLGIDWHNNHRNFATVTIGTARLISTVRALSASWSADAFGDVRAPRIAMVVPEAEQHRLGAAVAASRFRRLGVSVQMIIGCSTAEAARTIAAGDFDMACISLATRERVEHARRMIQMLRRSASRVPPIVVGGAVHMDPFELRTQVGADHVASDPEEALRLCGITTGAAGPAWSART